MRACGLNRKAVGAVLALVVMAATGALGTTALAQETPQGRGRGGIGGGAGYTVYKRGVDAHWFQNSTRFWYRNNLAGGASEFIVVDATTGTRGPAFDQQKLATALAKATDTSVAADKLPFEAIEFVDSGKAIRFTVNGTNYKCDLSSYTCSKTDGAPVGAAVAPFIPEPMFPMAQPRMMAAEDSAPEGGPVAFSDPEVPQNFGGIDLSRMGPAMPTLESALAGLNSSTWLPATYDLNAIEESLSPQAEAQQGGGAGGADAAGGRGAAGRGAAGGRGAGGRGAGRGAGGGGGGRGFGGGPTQPVASPDGKWTASIQNNNVFLAAANGGTETQLSTDGVEGNAYTRLIWTTDSQSLISYRLEPGEPKDVYRIQSSPPGQNGETGGGVGRAIPITQAYALPGDKFNQWELNIFSIANKKQIKPDVGRVDMTPAGSSPGEPNLNWKSDNIHFTYQKYDRGHQRVRLIEVNAHTGEVRNLVDDVADGKIQKFVWSANRDGIPAAPMFTPLNENETVYVSEMDGWRHMYLSNAAPAKQTFTQIDKGNWILRGIEYIDTQARQVWFSCGGAYPDQDQYLIHHGHVNFDGSNLVIMTAGNGNHTVAYSPDYKYIIDTYGNVDKPPVSELRRVSDGKLVCALEKAEVEGDWQHPEAFGAPGRDGKTMIWGVISRPRNFDPTKKYPIIEDIYAGPQGSMGTLAAKTFGTAPRNANLLNLGFITVKIDGMGSFGGSKAFHDVCWQNLKDAGFPDRIAWMKAAAAKYPYMDIERVGIFGTSAGGQNAAAAVLFYPDFYKVAVANSGCHDNRMDKATWNEQWMGYPVGPQYSESSNIDNAYRLKGRLQLVLGEQDTNVPPESTFRLVNALVQGGKDFEFVFVPNGGHGAGSPITGTKQQDFFVRYLLNTEPTNHNLEAAATGRGRGGGGGGGRGNRGGAGGGGATTQNATTQNATTATADAAGRGRGAGAGGGRGAGGAAGRGGGRGGIEIGGTRGGGGE